MVPWMLHLESLGLVWSVIITNEQYTSFIHSYFLSNQRRSPTNNNHHRSISTHPASFVSFFDDSAPPVPPSSFDAVSFQWITGLSSAASLTFSYISMEAKFRPCMVELESGDLIYAPHDDDQLIRKQA